MGNYLMTWENIQDIDLDEKMKMTVMSPIKNMHTYIMYTHMYAIHRSEQKTRGWSPPCRQRSSLSGMVFFVVCFLAFYKLLQQRWCFGVLWVLGFFFFLYFFFKERKYFLELLCSTNLNYQLTVLCGKHSHGSHLLHSPLN